MKFTALEEYGLRCILRLAQKKLAVEEHEPCGTASEDETSTLTFNTALTLGEIAADEGLTEQYAGKIFRILQKAKLVESVRGRKGGYRLSRSPEKITVAETLDALGGRFFDGEVCGRYTGDRHVCVRSTDCAIRSLWREVQALIDGVLEHTTLSDLASSEHGLSVRLQGSSRSMQAAQSGGFVPVGSIKNEISSPKKERTVSGREP